MARAEHQQLWLVVFVYRILFFCEEKSTTDDLMFLFLFIFFKNNRRV
jgi:hypothetical protein